MHGKESLFQPSSQAEIRRLVSGWPLAWVTSGAGADFLSTLLPIRPADPGTGPLTRLVGHLPRSNPQTAALANDPRAWLLFLGPNSYVSPSWLRNRRQAPTWNYVSVQFRVDIEFFDDPALLAEHMRDLVGAMEGDRKASWTVDELGQRYDALAARVIGFRAHVRETRAKFKLGQDEDDDTFTDIVQGLRQCDRAELAGWMERNERERAAPRS